MKKLLNVAVAALVGVVAGLMILGSASASGEDEAAPQSPARGKAYEVNDIGQSFGSAADALTPESEPDLILVISDEGREGFVKKNELNIVPASPEETEQIPSVRRIRVYDADGMTPVGWFTIGAEATTSGISE